MHVELIDTSVASRIVGSQDFYMEYFKLSTTQTTRTSIEQR